ncbi:MAG: hypothetical protein DI623_06760 [Sphingomonas sanxanigenens]|uniref:Uncharacterized protein n=1 Tax=Sphingomonas sanxanigenens TaxID=397260 RepID=A0A2W5ADM6_9SPHN|nr:MAG: hypothetical protein DI623_06760 [Sphingomonas sanxanigenens]
MLRSLSPSARRARRAGKLRAKAGDCLSIAVSGAGEDMAALIDEALRLALRARELMRNMAG